MESRKEVLMTSIRFLMRNAELDQKLEYLLKRGVDCNFKLTRNYVQLDDHGFENGVLVLQPGAYISQEALSRLNRLSTNVTLLVGGVSPRYMIDELRTKENFSMFLRENVGVTGKLVNDSYKLLFVAPTFQKALESFRDIVPGLYLTLKVAESVIRRWTFRERLRILFNI